MNTLQEFKQENLKKYQAMNLEELDESYPLNKISGLLTAAEDPNKATKKINWDFTPSNEFHDLFLNGDEVMCSTIHGVQIKSLESAWEELKSDDSEDVHLITTSMIK